MQVNKGDCTATGACIRLIDVYNSIALPNYVDSLPTTIHILVQFVTGCGSVIKVYNYSGLFDRI